MIRFRRSFLKETEHKVLSYIGFSVKAGKIVIGSNSVKEHRKKMYLIIVCHTAAQGTTEDAVHIAEKRNIPALSMQFTELEKAVNKENAKVAAITDKSLSQAIIDCADGNFEYLVRRDA